jgi:glycine cleavage system aminomethyltransferase T
MASETFTFYIQPWYGKSPFFEATKRHGCKSWGVHNHMLLPTLYEDPVAEYWALLNDVTLWDVAVERIVEITGPDAFEFTNLLTCRDLSTCAVGQCRYAILTARRARMRSVGSPTKAWIVSSSAWRSGARR